MAASNGAVNRPNMGDGGKTGKRDIKIQGKIYSRFFGQGERNYTVRYMYIEGDTHTQILRYIYTDSKGYR
jgi:hypothetical protein